MSSKTTRDNCIALIRDIKALPDYPGQKDAISRIEKKLHIITLHEILKWCTVHLEASLASNKHVQFWMDKMRSAQDELTELTGKLPRPLYKQVHAI